MGVYQYYEFLAIERPVSAEDQAEMRRISTRARITETRFVSEYNYGDFKGDPAEFVRRWFDIHMYLTNWGARELIFRLPKAQTDIARLTPFASEAVITIETDEHVIVDLDLSSDSDYDDVDSDQGWMARLALLRNDLMAGDYRLLYLLWLNDVWRGATDEDVVEPMAGVGSLSPSLVRAVEFFGFVDDVVEIATSRTDPNIVDRPSPSIRSAIAELGDNEKEEFLLRVAEGDLRVANELMALANRVEPSNATRIEATYLTAGELFAMFEPLEA